MFPRRKCITSFPGEILINLICNLLHYLRYSQQWRLTFIFFPYFTCIHQIPVHWIPSWSRHSATDKLHGAAPLIARTWNWRKLLWLFTLLHWWNTRAFHYFYTLIHNSIVTYTTVPINWRICLRLLTRRLLVLLSAVTTLQLCRMRGVPWTNWWRASVLHTAFLIAAFVVTRFVLRLLVRQAHLGGGHGLAVDQNHVDVDCTTSPAHQFCNSIQHRLRVSVVFPTVSSPQKVMITQIN